MDVGGFCSVPLTDLCRWGRVRVPQGQSTDGLSQERVSPQNWGGWMAAALT